MPENRQSAEHPEKTSRNLMGIRLALTGGMSCHVAAEAAIAARRPSILRLRAHPLKIALVGNPNVGKSVFFGRLTGRYATVSNYPGTTVTITSGRALVGAEVCDVIDTPGVNALEGVAQRGRAHHENAVERRRRRARRAGGRRAQPAARAPAHLAAGGSRPADDPRPQHARRGARARRIGRRAAALGAAGYPRDRGRRAGGTRHRRAERRAPARRAPACRAGGGARSPRLGGRDRRPPPPDRHDLARAVPGMARARGARAADRTAHPRRRALRHLPVRRRLRRADARRRARTGRVQRLHQSRRHGARIGDPRRARPRLLRRRLRPDHDGAHLRHRDRAARRHDVLPGVRLPRGQRLHPAARDLQRSPVPCRWG